MTDPGAYTNAFRTALTLILVSEGGRVDDPRDPGGRTNQGITQRTYDAWLKAHGEPHKDVWQISSLEVAAIYHNAYAAPIRFDDLPSGVGYCVLDEAVISGPMRAVMDLQGCLDVRQDGAVGEITLARIGDADPLSLIGDLCSARLTFERRLKAWATFGKGWSNRVATVRRNAIRLATPVAATTLVAS